MAGRRSVWSDPRVIARAARFVPAADEVWRLQRGRDADCRFFQRAVNGGELVTDGGSRQGIWVFAPSGKLLAGANALDPERVLTLLDRGLEAWDRLPPSERALAPEDAPVPAHRWEGSRPLDGLVLERIVRDLPTDVDLDAEPSGAWNRDFAWFARGELAGFLPPAGAAPGATYDVEPALVLRLARFSLVDNARGQSLPFAPEEVREAELRGTVVSREGERVSLAFVGGTRAEAEGPWLLGDNLWRPAAELPHAMETALCGEALWDGARFETFALAGVGRRAGRTENNGRRADEAPSLVGFSFVRAPRPERTPAPTFVALYGTDWIAAPPDASELAR